MCGLRESKHFGSSKRLSCIASGAAAFCPLKLLMSTTAFLGSHGLVTISGIFLPAHRSVNQKQKRDRLPGATLLASAQDRIKEWWMQGYQRAPNTLLAERFFTEVRASLPLLVVNRR